MNNPTTPQGAPINLPEAPEFLPSLLCSAMQEWAEAEAGDPAEEAFEHVTRKYQGALQSYARAAVIQDRVCTAASPDVAKMVETLMQEVGQYGLDCSLRGELAPRRSLAEAANALGAAATQARAAVGAEQSKDKSADDILTVAHITTDGGGILTMLAASLGDLIDIVGVEPETYHVEINTMTRADFEAMGEFDGF